MRYSFILIALCVFALPSLSMGQVPAGLQAEDWREIQAARTAERHKAIVDERGVRAHNPGQGLWAAFDGRGVLVEPESGAWSWGLQLLSFGFEGARCDVVGKVEARAEGGRVMYDWSDNLQEWYVNDARGLEHGYTLQGRPKGGGDEALVFELSVRGSLRAEVVSGGKDVNFLDALGKVQLNYAGLHVFDSKGVTQSATFVGSGKHLSIWVQESDAVYPLTIDPIAQQAYVKSSNPGAADTFGAAVAASGNLVVVGASNEDSDATGIDGDQLNDDAIGAGAVYVFERVAGVWSQQAYLKASNTDPIDRFGHSLAVSGDTIVVGAFNERSNASGVNGDQTNNSLSSAGAAYVFQRTGGVWAQQAYLKASNSGYLEGFGYSVAIDGDTIAVAAPYEDGPSTGVGGSQGDGIVNSGAVYIFGRTGTVWSQQEYIKASNTFTSDQFGGTLSMSGGLLAVGALYEKSIATGVDGDQFTRSMYDSGAVYLFERSGGAWSQSAYLKASNTDWNDRFGYSLAVSGETVIVGAPFEDSNSTGVDGAQSNGSILNVGAVYVFSRSAGVWSQQAYLKPSAARGHQWFGSSVAALGDRVIVGCSRESSGAVGVGGDPSLGSAPRSGAAYEFMRYGTQWSTHEYLKASNPYREAMFGASVALLHDLIVVGAWGERGSSPGIGGNQIDLSMRDAGAVYLFHIPDPVQNYCSPAIDNSSGLAAEMTWAGSTTASDNNATLIARHLPLNQFGYFLNSQSQGFAPNPGGSQGNLCIGGFVGRHNRASEVRNSAAIGAFSLVLDLTDLPTPLGSVSVVAGETWNFQAWFRDQNPGSTSNFTDGLSVTFE